MANGGIIGPIKIVCTPSTKVHTFTADGTFQKKNCTSTIPEVMVVAGGGAGSGGDSARAAGGGGGAGGYRTGTCVAMPNASLAITVGAGGTGDSDGPGTSGSNSVIA